MIVVDVETSGVDPIKNSLLSIGAIDFEDPSRIFYEECFAFDGAHLSEESFAINGYTKETATDKSKKSEEVIVKDFISWMSKSNDHTVAGQNPHFDTSFLTEAAHRYHINISIPKRVIDLHSICYFHMIKNGIKPPLSKNRSDLNSDSIMKYVGIPPEVHPHVAINGAKIEAEAFSRLFYDRSLLKEFSEFAIPWIK